MHAAAPRWVSGRPAEETSAARTEPATAGANPPAIESRSTFLHFDLDAKDFMDSSTLRRAEQRSATASNLGGPSSRPSSPPPASSTPDLDEQEESASSDGSEDRMLEDLLGSEEWMSGGLLAGTVPGLANHRYSLLPPTTETNGPPPACLSWPTNSGPAACSTQPRTAEEHEAWALWKEVAAFNLGGRDQLKLVRELCTLLRMAGPEVAGELSEAAALLSDLTRLLETLGHSRPERLREAIRILRANSGLFSPSTAAPQAAPQPGTTTLLPPPATLALPRAPPASLARPAPLALPPALPPAPPALPQELPPMKMCDRTQ